MTLEEKQKEFAIAISEFILWLDIKDYQVTMGEVWRSPETCSLYQKEGKGIEKSLHPLRLAIDLCLFKGGEYLTKSEDYREAGEHWESNTFTLGGEKVEFVWGGRWGDGNHFSIEHEGVR